MDISTLTYGAPATEPAPIEPIRVDGMAYAKIIAGMMNVGYFRERPTADGGSERVIVTKLVFPGDPSTVNRALVVTQAGLDGAMREQVEREQAERRARPKPSHHPDAGQRVIAGSAQGMSAASASSRPRRLGSAGREAAGPHRSTGDDGPNWPSLFPQAQRPFRAARSELSSWDR